MTQRFTSCESERMGKVNIGISSVVQLPEDVPFAFMGGE